MGGMAANAANCGAVMDQAFITMLQTNGVRAKYGPDAIGYWVNTPEYGGKHMKASKGSPIGGGAEVFHRAGCTFRPGQKQSVITNTPCDGAVMDFADGKVTSWKDG